MRCFLLCGAIAQRLRPWRGRMNRALTGLSPPGIVGLPHSKPVHSLRPTALFHIFREFHQEKQETPAGGMAIFS